MFAWGLAGLFLTADFFAGTNLAAGMGQYPGAAVSALKENVNGMVGVGYHLRGGFCEKDSLKKKFIWALAISVLLYFLNIIGGFVMGHTDSLRGIGGSGDMNHYVINFF